MESRSLLEFLIQCIVIISTVTGGTWWLFEKAELVLAADRKRTLAQRIKNFTFRNPFQGWAVTFVSVFDAVFGRPVSLGRTGIASVLSVALLFLCWNVIHPNALANVFVRQEQYLLGHPVYTLHMIFVFMLTLTLCFVIVLPASFVLFFIAFSAIFVTKAYLFKTPLKVDKTLSPDEGAKVVKEYLLADPRVLPSALGSIIVSISVLYLWLLYAMRPVAADISLSTLEALADSVPWTIRWGALVLGPIASYLTAVVVLNVVPDYLSLVKTRWIIGHLQQDVSVLMSLLLLGADLALTVGLFVLCGWLHPSYGSMERFTTELFRYGIFMDSSFGDNGLLGADYSLGPFFYSTFFTSAWAGLCVLSIALARIASSLRRGVEAGVGLLDVDNKPVRSLGFVATLLVGAICMMMAALLWYV